MINRRRRKEKKNNGAVLMGRRERGYKRAAGEGGGKRKVEVFRSGLGMGFDNWIIKQCYGKSSLELVT